MSGTFRGMLSSKIFSFLFTLIIIALIGLYGYGTYHAYRHSTFKACIAGFLIIPSFYYVYESETAEHHPCAVQDCDRLAIEEYETSRGRLFICDADDPPHSRLKRGR